MIATTIGRGESVVTSRRKGKKIPAFSRWPGGGPGWTAEELALLGTADDEVIAAKIERTVGAVMQKRQALRIEVFRDRRVSGNWWQVPAAQPRGSNLPPRPARDPTGEDCVATPRVAHRACQLATPTPAAFPLR